MSEGRLDNPKFSLSADLLTRFTVTIAQKLGLGVVKTGETVIIQGSRILKGVGRKLQRIFK